MQGFAQYYKPWTPSRIDNLALFFTLRLCHAKKYVVKKDDKDAHTMVRKQLLAICPHPLITLFDGGSLHFPYEERNNILKHIAFDIAAGTPMYFNQIAYEKHGCRLVIDVDSDRLLCPAEIGKFGTVLATTLAAYYTAYAENPVPIVVDVCGPRMKSLKMSTGVHLIAHVDVTIQQGRQITHGFKLRAQSDPGINMQDIVIDNGIYKTKSEQMSLRMIYSNKVEKCVMCLDDTFARQACELCKSKGMVVSNFVYEPRMFMVGGQDKFDETHTDFLSILKLHSIWPEPQDVRTDYCRPVLDPEVGIETKKRKADPMEKPSKTHVSNSDYDALEEELRNISFEDEQVWKHILVKNVERKSNSTTAQIYVDGIGSTMCLYARKDHGTRAIWFSLNKKGVLTLRCGSEVHKCSEAHKDERVIRFTISQRVTNNIFGLENPPSLDDVCSAPVSSACSKEDSLISDKMRQLSQIYKIKKK